MTTENTEVTVMTTEEHSTVEHTTMLHTTASHTTPEPLPSSALTTLAAVKEQLQITGSSQDSFLSALILRASGEMEHFCQRHFLEAEYTEIHQVEVNDKFVYVDESPISEIDHIRAMAFPGDEATVIASTNYYAQPKTMGKILFRPGTLANVWSGTLFGSWPGDTYDKERSPFWLEVKYTAGYATIPDEIEGICKQYVVALYGMRDQNLALKSERVVQYAYELNSSTEVQKWLENELMLHRKPAKVV